MNPQAGHNPREGDARPRVVAVGGSVRPGNYTGRVLEVLCDELAALGTATVHVRPAEWRLPLPGAPDDGNGDPARLRALLSGADALVFATPLYNGSYSSVTKLIIDNLGYPSVLAGRPVGLVGVAASPAGAERALRHLEEVCRHIRCRVLPGSVSVADVWNAFDAGGLKDDSVRAALRSLANRVASAARAAHTSPHEAVSTLGAGDHG